MQTLLIAPTRNGVGLSSTALGLARALERQGLRAAFLKPIAQTYETTQDDSVHFARTVAHLTPPEPIPLARAEDLLSHGGQEDLMEEVIALAQHAAGPGVDVLVVEGLALNERNAYAGALNAALARNLGADSVLVSSLSGVGAAELVDELEIAAGQHRRSDGSGLAGYVLNFAPAGLDYGALLSELRSRSPLIARGELPLLGVVALSPDLQSPRTLDVARALGAAWLNEGEARVRRVTSTVVTARSVPKMAHLLGPGALVVTPGDREDVVMAAALSHLSGVPLAGLMLTSDSVPEDSITQLCAAALGRPGVPSDLPVMRVGTNSFHTASALSRLSPRVPHDDPERMERMLDFIADRLDTLPLTSRLRARPDAERRLPPSAFRHELILRARAAAKRIVLPEGDEPRTVQAAIRCTEKGIARCVLLARPERVAQVAQGQGLSVPDGLEIIDPDTVRERYVAPMVELRKAKGLTAPQALAQLEDSVVLGTMMLALGEVDGLVSGAVHTTANTVRPALQLIKTAPGASLVSSVFFMLMPEQVLVYGDAAINPNPNAEELADIAIQSADSARAFGITPRVAMLSYSTGESGSGEDVEKVKAATALVRQQRPDISVDGPLQYDAAAVLSVGLSKAPDSPVAGRATVFIFPDLNTGNTTYKAVQRAAGVVAVGPMLQGLRKPVNDLSRGALVDDIVYTIALTAIQATQTQAAVSGTDQPG
ncbi:phosphate acetyltransferase [Deinococcus metalli]|uniref:Phosphate acetyltransferase n=1 Tax=Deinococcus metalli TaxID=1141878 RepID=A0A7W8KKU7_9DEIO|nr:phosphate acetyltransferase [Deinococcus metalli]MBB5378389.1 phosphate acetyltransferase [Deinococcus metalli]GHF59277.1 phosphate acetyltransferase [Deinococcus metalli]